MTSRFTLGAVHIEGATAFSQESLSREFEPYLATEVDEAVLKAIAKRITDRYQEAGYLLSYAYLPKQDVRAGIVRIVVVEGRVDEVVVEGAGRDRATIEAMATRLMDRQPLRIGELERTIGLIRDLPGFAVTDASLAPTADPASHVLKLVVARDRVKQLLFADNRGPADSDRARLYSSTSLSSLATAGDEFRLDLFAIPTHKFRYLYGQVGAALPIGKDGLRLAAWASAGDLRQRGNGLRIDGESTNYSAQLSYPVLRSRVWKLVGKAVISDLRNVSDDNDVRIQRDRLRVARVGLDFAIEAKTRVFGDLAVSRGLGFDGRTRAGDPLASRPDAGGRFTKAMLNVQIAHPLSERMALNVAMTGQLSDRPLLLVEEMALGGNRIGRAYDFNAVTGDRGIAGAMELSYRLPDPAKGPRKIELFGFVDGGVVGQSGHVDQPGRR
ncbi:MAG: ShlB/FhaC/HecB family hemolysin secretion/activation protein, partial [Sphingomicrobium sp.]